MTLFIGQTGSQSRRRGSQLGGLAAVMIAAAAVFGWLNGLPLLLSWGRGLPAARPAGTLCLAVLGFALMRPGRDHRFAAGAGVTVALVAAIFLGLLVFKFDGAIHWLAAHTTPPWADRGALGTSHMATLAFGLAGCSLALSGFERCRFVAIVLACFAAAIVTFALLGYATAIETLYGRATFALPPLPSAVGLLCVATGIILRIEALPELRTPQPLWRLLILLGCAIVVPLLLFGVYAGTRMADAQLSQVRDDLTRDARTLSAEVDREIGSEIGELQALAVSPALRQGDFAAFQRQAEASIAYRQGGNIMLVDRHMQQLVNTWVPYGTPLEKAAIPDTVEKVLETGRPQITNLFTGPERLVVGISVPVQIDGEDRYALIRPADHGALASLVAARQQQPSLHVTISDAERRIVVRSEQGRALTAKTLLAAQWNCPGSGGVFEFTDSEGPPSLGAYACSDLTGWQTTIWQPKAVLEAPVLALWRTLGWLALLAFLLVVGLALWLGRIMAGSVGHAARAATALGEGRPLPLGETPVAEVNTLMAELREAAARRQSAAKDLQASKDQLQASKDRLQVAFDATRLGWWQSNQDGSEIVIDARHKEIFDLTADVISIDDVMQRLHPDDLDAFRQDRAAALDPVNPRPIALEYRIRRRDGEVRWVETHGLAHFEGTGPERRVVSLSGTVQDITERKDREEKEHLLMREINHRAKNMLCVVDAIAHQTAARNPADFVERFSERVQALSANQDLLVRNEWKGVEIADLVRAQLAHFSDLICSRIVLQGPRLRLNPASAQAIGLALHELATNAGKYGALSTDKGTVDVAWGVSEGGIFNMSWTEREGPPVAAPERRGFGTTVIEAMAARSVDGAVRLDYEPTGVIWRLTCRAAGVLESARGMTNGHYSARPAAGGPARPAERP